MSMHSGASYASPAKTYWGQPGRSCKHGGNSKPNGGSGGLNGKGGQGGPNNNVGSAGGGGGWISDGDCEYNPQYCGMGMPGGFYGGYAPNVDYFQGGFGGGGGMRKTNKIK